MKTQKLIDFLKNDADGHSIFEPEFIYEFCPEAKALNTKQESGTTHKETIYSEGKRVDELEGIYSLDLLYWLCKHFNLDSKNMYGGRGAQARHCVKILLAHLES